MKGQIHQPHCAVHPENSAGLVGKCTCTPQTVELNEDETMKHVFKLIGKKEKK